MSKNSNYQETVDYILSIPKFAKKIGTENLLQILARLRDPHRAVPAIHVAGTNGKGSTCAFLQAIYRKAGLKVGMFTSPHLVKLNERFRINGSAISDEEFVRVFQKVQTLLLGMQDLPYPSFFELMFLLAAVYFREQRVDIAIYETGMGGRLDATNVLEPKLSIITSVGMDHTQYLGDTIEQIAFEKAGIIKKQTPVVAFFRDPIADAVIERQAEKMHAPLYPVEKKDYMIHKINGKTIDFSIDCEYYKCDTATIKQTGLYQVENAVLALVATSVFPGYHPEHSLMEQALLDMQWEGRMECILPGVYLDGAHNDEAILMWRRSIDRLFTGQKKRLLFAVAADKDYQDMIPHICRDIHYEKIYITRIPGERAADVESIADRFAACTEDALSVIPDTRMAFLTACRERAEKENLFLVGSLYLAGAVKGYLEEQ